MSRDDVRLNVSDGGLSVEQRSIVTEHMAGVRMPDFVFGIFKGEVTSGIAHLHIGDGNDLFSGFWSLAVTLVQTKKKTVRNITLLKFVMKTPYL